METELTDVQKAVLETARYCERAAKFMCFSVTPEEREDPRMNYYAKACWHVAIHIRNHFGLSPEDGE